MITAMFFAWAVNYQLLMRSTKNNQMNKLLLDSLEINENKVCDNTLQVYSASKKYQDTYTFGIESYSKQVLQSWVL